jgi:hypothetical protein
MTVPNLNRLLAALQLWRPARYKLAAGLLTAIVLSFTSHSQTVGNWTFNNTLSGTGGTYNTVSAASLGPGIPVAAFNGGLEYFGESGWPTGVLNTNDYFQFSISPNTSYELNLTDIVLRMRRSNTGSPAGSGPTQWSLRSSLDGFTTNIASGSMTHVYSNYAVTLTGFHHLYTTVTFRLYGYSVTIPSGGTSRLVMDNISIQGLTSVLAIEPSGINRNAPVKEREKAATNPFISFVSISGQSAAVCVQAPADDDYTILLHATNGVLMQKRKLHVKAGSNTVMMPLNEVPHGVYTVSLYDMQLISSKRVAY